MFVRIFKVSRFLLQKDPPLFLGISPKNAISFGGFHFLGAPVTRQPFATSAIQNKKVLLQHNAAEHFHDAFF